LLTSGALIERKGIDFAIKIIELARNSISENIQLLILGEGPLKKSLQHLAKEQSVYLLGFKQKDEIPYYFNISDVFLFCSRYDGWGLVINEAISTGLPCLVSKDVGSSELIVNHANGFVCDNACLQTYVDAIKLLYNDRILLKSISQNNQQLADTINSAAMAIKLNLFLQNNF
jgi:glycosyltransferase involved in cell wall biosynthesis